MCQFEKKYAIVSFELCGATVSVESDLFSPDATHWKIYIEGDVWDLLDSNIGVEYITNEAAKLYAERLDDF